MNKELADHDMFSDDLPGGLKLGQRVRWTGPEHNGVDGEIQGMHFADEGDPWYTVQLDNGVSANGPRASFDTVVDVIAKEFVNRAEQEMIDRLSNRGVGTKVTNAFASGAVGGYVTMADGSKQPLSAIDDLMKDVALNRTDIDQSTVDLARKLIPDVDLSGSVGKDPQDSRMAMFGGRPVGGGLKRDEVVVLGVGRGAVCAPTLYLDIDGEIKEPKMMRATIEWYPHRAKRGPRVTRWFPRVVKINAYTDAQFKALPTKGTKTTTPKTTVGRKMLSKLYKG